MVEPLESRRLLAASIEVGPKILRYNDEAGGGGSVEQRIAIRNNGDTPLIINPGQITLVGDNPDQFAISTPVDELITIAPNTSKGLYVTFDPGSGADVGSIQTAHLRIRSNDPNVPVFKGVALRGLVTSGTGGTNEPSLQRILDLYQIPIDVADNDPDTVALNDPHVFRDSEVFAPRFTRAAAGPVTIEPIAAFGVASRPAVKFGYYEPGTPGYSTNLLDVPNSSAQTVDVRETGATAFDPGSEAFGLYATFPGFTDNDGQARTVYSEDVLNTWEPTNRFKHKVRVFPLKDGAGRTVANTFVVAFEEFTGNNVDQQDFVAILRNVAPVASSPEIGLEPLNGAPFPDRLVFNQIGTKNADVRVLDRSTLRIHNTGSRTLTISDAVVSGPFEIVGDAPTSIAPGGFDDITVRFTATGGTIHPASLQLFSNDRDEPKTVVTLTGLWQSQPEGTNERSLQQIVRALGYGTVITSGGQQLDQGGASTPVGDEILSGYWAQADPSVPVTAQQLAAFHTEGVLANFYWHEKGSNTGNRILTHEETDAQSLFPRLQNESGPAVGTFKPSLGTVFGFRVDANEWSDDSKNTFGHQLRFFPARDPQGNFLPNTYLLVMDYDGINYDFNDNVYLISNIRPEDVPASPVGLGAGRRGSGVGLTWGANPNGPAEGYYVYRSTQPLGGFALISDGAQTGTSFVDNDVQAGNTYYYRVRTTADGETSVPTQTSIRFV